MCVCVRAESHDARLLVVLWLVPGVHVGHAALEERLLGAVHVLRERHGHADGQGQHAAEALRVHVVVLEPAELGVLVAGLGLEDLGERLVLGHGPAQGRLGRAGVARGPVLVYLIFGVVVRHDHRSRHELHVLQPGVVGPIDDPLPGGPFLGAEGAALHGPAVQILVVLVRQVALSQLVHHLGVFLLFLFLFAGVCACLCMRSWSQCLNFVCVSVLRGVPMRVLASFHHSSLQRSRSTSSVTPWTAPFQKSSWPCWMSGSGGGAWSPTASGWPGSPRCRRPRAGAAGRSRP